MLFGVSVACIPLKHLQPPSFQPSQGNSVIWTLFKTLQEKKVFIRLWDPVTLSCY